MYKTPRILLSIALLYFAYAGAAAADLVKIDPSGYAGLWTIDYGPPQQGPATVALGPVDPVVHAHVISIGGAEFFFNLASNGRVTVSPSAAATTGIRYLRFNTTTIKVDPVFFAGSWRVVAGGTGKLAGVQNITLVRGLEFYNMEVGPTGGFSFHVGADGTVSVPNALAASGGANTLTLNNTERFLK